MATALAVATSRLSSDSHSTSSAENTPSAVHRLQMAIADTECAQALLELAMSIVPSSAADSPGPEQPEGKTNVFTAGQNAKSLLKRELESPLESNSSLTSDEENLRSELVKRIKLDHNYYWTGDDRKVNEVKLEPDQFRTYCETIKQNGSVPVSEPNLEDNHDGYNPSSVMKRSEVLNGCLEESKQVLGQSIHVKPELMRSVRPRTMSESCASPMNKSPRPRSVSESKVGQLWKVKEEKKTSILKSKSIKRNDNYHAEAVNIKHEDSSESDGRLEGDEKFHNFHLLMKCLVANEPDLVTSGSEPSRSSYRTQSMSSDDTDEGQRSSPDNLTLGSSSSTSTSHDYQCHVCQRTFRKKRYLTKHAFRMHPWLGGEEGTAIKITFEGFMCPHCKLNIKPKRDLQRHIANCPKNNKRWKTQNELDLVNCQFCGVRMRRQLLVRHLAEEHCVDRMGEFPEDGSNYVHDDQQDGHNLGAELLEAKGDPGSRGSFPSFQLGRSNMSSAQHKSSMEADPSDMSWKDVVEFGAIKKEEMDEEVLVKQKPGTEFCM